MTRLADRPLIGTLFARLQCMPDGTDVSKSLDSAFMPVDLTLLRFDPGLRAPQAIVPSREWHGWDMERHAA